MHPTRVGMKTPRWLSLSRFVVLPIFRRSDEVLTVRTDVREGTEASEGERLRERRQKLKTDYLSIYGLGNCFLGGKKFLERTLN